MKISGITYVPRKTHKFRNFLIVLVILIAAVAAVLFFFPDIRAAIVDFITDIIKTFPFLKG